MHSSSTKRFKFIIIIGLAGFLMVLSSVHGQIMYGLPASGDVRVVYSHWSLEGSSGTTEINQLTIPITGFIPIRDNLEAFFFVANSSNSLKRSNTDYNLSGLGDARLQLNSSFNEDQLLLSAGINLPTGKKKLSRDEELLVVQELSQNYLSFPMRLFGEGFGFNILFGGAQMIGELRCGAGIMYQFNGDYQPYEDTGTYDPGDFVSINAGVDWERDRTTLTGDVVFTTYTDDKFSGVKSFKRSSQVAVRLGAVYDDGHEYGISGGISYLLRGRNTLYATAKELKIFGNEFRISGNLTRRFQQGWHVSPSAELKLIGSNEDGFDSSTIFGLGGAVGRTFSEQVGVNVGFKYFTGNADGGDIDLSGFQLTASVMGNL